VTDVVGRVVTVKRDSQRILLGEGRQLYLVAALEPEDPFKRIVGWPDDFRTTDLVAYDQYKAKFPQMAQIPIFGSPSSASFSVEKAIEVRPSTSGLTSMCWS
jgi:iron complex transport system substrate-binding protein